MEVIMSCFSTLDNREFPSWCICHLICHSTHLQTNSAAYHPMGQLTLQGVWCLNKSSVNLKEYHVKCKVAFLFLSPFSHSLFLLFSLIPSPSLSVILEIISWYHIYTQSIFRDITYLVLIISSN